MPVVKDSYGLPAIIRPGSPHQKSGASGRAINSVMPDATRGPDEGATQGHEAYGQDTYSKYKKGGMVKKAKPKVAGYAKGGLVKPSRGTYSK
jgi:hypothetical protein